MTKTIANKSQFQFIIPDLSSDAFLVQHFRSYNLGLSKHYAYDVHCLSTHQLEANILSGKTAKLIMVIRAIRNQNRVLKIT